MLILCNIYLGNAKNHVASIALTGNLAFKIGLGIQITSVCKHDDHVILSTLKRAVLLVLPFLYFLYRVGYDPGKSRLSIGAGLQFLWILCSMHHGTHQESVTQVRSNDTWVPPPNCLFTYYNLHIFVFCVLANVVLFRRPKKQNALQDVLLQWNKVSLQ